MSTPEEQRKARNAYMNGLVSAALAEWAHGRFPDPPYPPPPRVARPTSCALGLTAWPPGDPRSTPWVLNQFHPDHDPLAALRYMAVVGWGRRLSACLRLRGFDAALFGSTTSQAFSRAQGAMKVLAKWCGRMGYKPVLEGVSLAIAEGFIISRIKAESPLREIAAQRDDYAKVWDFWLSREAEWAANTFRHFGPVAFEPMENPWRQIETDPVHVDAHGAFLRSSHNGRHLTRVSLASSMHVKKARAMKSRRAWLFAQDASRWLRLVETEGVDMANNSAIARAFDKHGFLTSREFTWDSKEVSRLKARLNWKQK